MTEIQGWLDPNVAQAMRELILRTKPEVVVEIGVYAGKSLINSALALKENGRGVIYGIDPWRTKTAIHDMAPNENVSFWANTDLDDVHAACMHAIWEHEVEKCAVIIRATSYAARCLFEPQSIDMLYIDGGHSEEASTRDVSIYLTRVRHRGHIWIDDTDYPSLQKAIGILKTLCNLVSDFGHCHLYRKL